MSTITPTLPRAPAEPGGDRGGDRSRLNAVDRRGNAALKGLALAGGAVIFVAMVGIAYEVINGASQAISHYGPAFVVHSTWNPNATPAPQLGAWTFIYGTLMTSITSLIAATVLGVSIGIYLAMLAPKPFAAVVGPMVEMLAAVPSVIVGFIGLVLIAPFSQSTIAPALHTLFGWIPLIGKFFGEVPESGQSIFLASLVLTIMVVPIISALSRDLFLTVPRELREGAEALGSTRWEVIRGVVLPTTSSGILAACVLGFGRAIGESIAVLQVVGGLSQVSINQFNPGNTIASVLASQFPSPVNDLHLSGLYYLGVILFVFEIIVNLIARQISAGFRARMA
jgi:phosphate transport system permease protein